MVALHLDVPLQKLEIHYLEQGPDYSGSYDVPPGDLFPARKLPLN
jgi:hypothetical protein